MDWSFFDLIALLITIQCPLSSLCWSSIIVFTSLCFPNLSKKSSSFFSVSVPEIVEFCENSFEIVVIYIL
jgi:hypothetical protein